MLLVLGCVGYVGYRWVGNGEGGFSDTAKFLPEIMQNRIEVRLAPVTVRRGRSADAVVVATGYLESRRQAKIGARTAGLIDTVFFEEGNKVAKGELLAELDHKDMDAALAAASASVDRAKATLAEHLVTIEQAATDLKRAERLRRSNSLAESDYDQFRFAHQSALARKASLETEITLAIAQEMQANQLRENMFIRAPFAGTVISKDAEAGESIMPGGTGGTFGRGSVATIADLDHLEIEVDVQEDFISRVVEGQQADIVIDAVPEKKYHGNVRKIIPMGDRARATIKVKVEISDADEMLFPEMAGTVYFIPSDTGETVDDQPRLFCPASAIARDGDDSARVWIVDDQDRAASVAITTGTTRDQRIEITAGLSAGQLVIVNPADLHEGAPVKVVD